MARKLFLDIETIPAGDESHEKLRVLYEKKLARGGGTQPGGKDGESFEDFVSKTSFDGAFGRILCIGYAVDDQPADNFYNEGNERKTLEQFWDLARTCGLFIGHNVMDFDLRFIYQRSMVLGVKPSVDLNFARYRNFPIFDTMREWTKWSMGNVGLEALAFALDIPSPKGEGIDGSQVFEFYKNGKIKDILEYCKRDVDTTRAVYKKMTFQNQATLF